LDYARYFGATLWKGRPKLAIEDPLATMPTQEPERSAEAIRRALPELIKLNRYESRAVARRDRAVRQLSKRRISENQLKTGALEIERRQITPKSRDSSRL
jgi:hypothetical protein